MKLLVRPIDKAVTAEAGVNLLEVLLKEQVPISYSCMSGSYGVCRCNMVEGSVGAHPR